MASGASLELEKAKQVAQLVVGDVATMVHGALCYIGDRMGLFKAMMNAGPLTVERAVRNPPGLAIWATVANPNPCPAAGAAGAVLAAV